MKKQPLTLLVLLLSLLTIAPTATRAWGVWGHQHINRSAVLALPDPMRIFYYNHVDFLTEESVMPDVRKYTLNDKSEFPRHFIDLEAYGDRPLETLPRTWSDAYARLDEKMLQQHGLLPWYIQQMMEKLTRAFREKRKADILLLSADMAHYLADAHMPLHTAQNHDGQLTGQQGIHAFWESQLPELFGRGYRLNPGEARYLSDPVAETWRIIGESHAKADSLLTIEKQLREGFPAQDVYQLDQQGQVLKNKFRQPIHSPAYAAEYHRQLRGMVERQMRAAIAASASFWYTAWVNAGKPNLIELDSPATTKSHRRNLKRESRLWKRGRVKDLKTDPEF